MADVSVREVTDAIWAVMGDEQPDVVHTFGPDGVFGHPHHIAVGAATDAAFHRARATPGPASGEAGPFRRLLHGAIPESVFRRWNAQRASMGLPEFDRTRIYHMRGVPDVQIGIEVDCRTVADRIVAGLHEHRSQHHVMSDDPDHVTRWRRIVSREWHVIAWPQTNTATRLRDIFDELPS